MSRLIDADALWMDIIHAMDYCDDILEIIEQQPTVESERRTGKWIPCSERLPEVKEFWNTQGVQESSDYVLLTITDCANGFRKKIITLGRYVHEYKWYKWKLYRNSFGRVLAWMPLPKPYREDNQ